MSWCSNESGLLRSACLMGAELEGGSLSGPWAIGDGGLAVGPYQEHPSYGSTAVRGSGASAWQAIRGDYVRCLSAGDGSAHGLAVIVQCAERPANAYPQDRVQNAYSVLTGANAVDNLGNIVNSGGGIPGVDGVANFAGGVASKIPGVAGIGQLAGGVSGIAALLAKVLDTITNPDFIVSILLVFGGFFIGVMGLFNLASKSATVKTAVQAGAMAGG